MTQQPFPAPARPVAPLPAAEEASRPERLREPLPSEVGGPKGPEPTRYGDWESKGRVSDF